MNILMMAPEIQNLARLGDTGIFEDHPWIDYLALGISKQYIPELIKIIEEIDDFMLLSVSNPMQWMPLHAWRALGQLKAVEALPVLIALLERIDEDDDETVQVDLPLVFGQIGPAAIPALSAYFNNLTNGAWARLAAAEGLVNIALNENEHRSEVISLLVKSLEQFRDNKISFNSLLVEFLTRLEAVEAVPIVEQAFQAEQVDDEIAGDFEDYLVNVGLLEQRLNAPTTNRISPAAFRDGMTVDLSKPDPNQAARKHRQFNQKVKINRQEPKSKQKKRAQPPGKTKKKKRE